MKPRKLASAVALFSALAASLTLNAATYTWTGGTPYSTGAQGYNMNEATNWDGDVAPPANSDLVFGSVTDEDYVRLRGNFGARLFNSITFSADASGFNYVHTAYNVHAYKDGMVINNLSTSLQSFASSSATNVYGLQGVLTLNASQGDILFSGYLADNGTYTGSVVKEGAAALYLGANNTFTGNLTIKEGTVVATSAGALGDNTAGTVEMTGGTLELATAATAAFGRDLLISTDSTIIANRSTAGAGVTYSFGALNIADKTLSIVAGSNVTSGTASVNMSSTSVGGTTTFDVGEGALLFTNAITGEAGTNIIKTGVGALQVYTSADFYGDITLQNGDIRFQTATGSFANSTIFIEGGRIASNAYNQHRTIGASLVFAGDFAYGDESASGNLTFTNASAILLKKNVAINTTANSSAVLDSYGNYDLVGSSLILNGGLDDEGNGYGITKTGSGKLVLAGTGNYTGGVRIEDGVLEVRQGSSLGNGTLNLAGGMLRIAYSTDNAFGQNTIVSASSSIVIDRFSGSAIYGVTLGNLSIGTSTLSVTKGSALAAGSNLTFGDTTLTGNATFNVAADTTLFIGNITGGTNSITKTGDGIMQFTGGNGTYGDVILDGGWIQYRYTPIAAGDANNQFIFKSGQFSSQNTAGRVFYRQLVFDGDVTLGDTVSNGAMQFNGEATLNGTRTITALSEVRFNGSFSEVTAGSGLIKTGEGDFYLNAANTYTGNTVVAGGNLIVNGSLKATTIAQTGTQISGNGTFENLTIQNGAKLSPGNSPGTLTVTNLLTLEIGSTLFMEIDGSNFDKIVANGLTLNGGTLELNFLSALTADANVQLFDVTSLTGPGFESVSLSGSYSGSLVDNSGVWTYTDGNNNTFSLDMSTGYLSVTAIPEPSTYALIFGLAVLTFIIRRRRQR